MTIYGIWNLDFFRPFIPATCLHRNTKTIHVIALEYFVPLYVLFLILFAYAGIELHARDFRPIVWIWRPFHHCLGRFRQSWNVKASILEAFSTLLVLSYAKIAYVSVSMLCVTQILNIHGKQINKPYFFFFDATMEYGGKEHLPFLLLAVFLLVVGVLFPAVLLTCYQFKWFQSCLNRCRLNRHGLRAFIEVFQGQYRNGTNGGRDLRFFAGFRLFTVVFVVAAELWFYGSSCLELTIFFINGVLFHCYALLLALICPYRGTGFNYVSTFLFLLIGFLFLLIVYQTAIDLLSPESSTNYDMWQSASIVGLLVLVSMRAVYFIIILTRWAYKYFKLSVKV